MAALSDAAYVAYAMKTSRYIQKAEDFLGKSEIPVKPFLGNRNSKQICCLS